MGEERTGGRLAGDLPIIQYWHSEEVPGEIAELLESFAELNPGRPHLVFDEAAAAAFVAERCGQRHARAFGACAVPAMQADYFRYCAVLGLGGAYVDADSRCVASLDSLIPAAGLGRLFQRPPNGPVVNGGFAFGAPGHPFLELALEVATANIERRDSEHVYATTGPLIFTNLHRLHRLGSFEAFLELMGGRRFEPAARALCETVGEYERVSRAFEGVSVSSLAENVWVRSPEELPAYKQAEHWASAGGGIFRGR